MYMVRIECGLGLAVCIGKSGIAVHSVTEHTVYCVFSIVPNQFIVLLRLRQSLLRSITIDLSKKNRDVDVDSMSHGHVD